MKHVFGKSQHQGFTKGEDSPRVTYNWETWLLSMSHISQTLDIAYIDFFKTFNVVSHSLFLKKLMHCGPVFCAVGGKLTRHTHSMLEHICFSNCKPVTNAVPHGSILGPGEFNLFILDGIKCTLMKFVNKLNGKVDISEGRVTL